MLYLKYFKLSIVLDQNCRALNIKTKHHHVAKIYGLEKLRLWQEKQFLSRRKICLNVNIAKRGNSESRRIKKFLIQESNILFCNSCWSLNIYQFFSSNFLEQHFYSGMPLGSNPNWFNRLLKKLEIKPQKKCCNCIAALTYPLLRLHLPTQ